MKRTVSKRTLSKRTLSKRTLSKRKGGLKNRKSMRRRRIIGGDILLKDALANEEELLKYVRQESEKYHKANIKTRNGKRFFPNEYFRDRDTKIMDPINDSQDKFIYSINDTNDYWPFEYRVNASVGDPVVDFFSSKKIFLSKTPK
jgi:hypothetical protein